MALLWCGGMVHVIWGVGEGNAPCGLGVVHMDSGAG